MAAHEGRGRDNRERQDPANQMGASPGRVPPHDLDAEAAVLSSILLEPLKIDELQEILSVDHFYSPANRRIYEACLALAQHGTPIDSVTVASWLKSRERLTEIGGVPYLARIVDAAPAVANLEAYARTVKEKWRIRSLISTCQRVAAEGYGDVGGVQGFIDNAEQTIYELARTPESSTVSPIRDVVRSAFKKMEEAAQRGDQITGRSTGFAKLDELTSGLHPGDLNIVAARPGMGKTSFVLNVAVNVAAQKVVNDVEVPGYGCVVFTLEMPKDQIAMRMVCSEAHVDVGKVRRGALRTEDWTELTRAATFLSSIPLWVDDTPAITLLDVRSKVRRIQAELSRGGGPAGVNELGLVIIDYLQLMKGRDGVNNREQEISEISRGLKQLAKELKVPVIALSQLNRAVETRAGKDKRPQLSDLRESGAIEQDADMIVFIYRDDYYNKESSELKGIAEIIVAKQRNGPTGKVPVRFTASSTRFDNLDPGDIPQGFYED
jgi:replicative DNA helicase